MSLQYSYQNPLWHPCSQMKDYEQFEPLAIASASGCYLHLKDGRKIIDAISSWWCKSLGHNHPELKKALLTQLDLFEHVLLANTTNDTIAALSHALTQLMPSLCKVFYASEGSSAIEIAMKMSVHAHQLNGANERKRFVALSKGYHGETLGALSISDLGLYKKPYQPLLLPCTMLSPLPYVSGIDDPLWLNAEAAWLMIKDQLDAICHEVASVVVEPIVQGAGGMLIYSQDLLRRLRAYTKQHGIHLIADEIMVGFGRTGKMLACEHAEIQPDFICLSKGLTSGWLPLSAVLTTQPIYDLFYADYAEGKAFLHSHTFSGNALAASVALTVLTLFKTQPFCAKAVQMGDIMHQNMVEIATETEKLTNVRTIGAITAADLVCSPHERKGYALFQQAVARGALLRPLGNTIYWLPPLISEREMLMELKVITQASIEAIDNF